ILPAESRKNTIDPSVALTNSLATDYDSADESLVCSNPLPPLKKLEGTKPISRPNTIKSILKSKSTLKAEALKGVIINKPFSTPAKGNKSSSALKVHSAPIGKLKSVKIKDDPSLAIVMKELNIQVSKNQSSYSKRPKVVFGDDSTCTTKDYGSIKCNGIVFLKFDEKRGTIFNTNKEIVMIDPRKKSQTPKTITSFIKRVKNQNDIKVKQLRNDNGIEFKNSILINFIEAARIMLSGSVFSKHYWIEVVAIACYTQNGSTIMKRHLKTPYEIFLVTPAPQDRWCQDKQIELVNIIGNPGAVMLTRAMAKQLSVASAHECLFVDFLSEEESKKVPKGYSQSWSVYLKYLGFDLKGYSDSDYARCNMDRKSTSGAAEAEYVDAVGCCANILWMKSQLTYYDIIYEKVPIFCDNTSAIAISNNPVLHSRTKHIDIRYHFIRDYVLKGDIELHFIPTQYQLADIITKPLDEPTFKRLIVELGHDVSADSTAEADSGIYAPKDSISSKQVKMEDLSDIFKDTRSAFFTLDSPTYEPIIVLDESEEDEERTERAPLKIPDLSGEIKELKQHVIDMKIELPVRLRVEEQSEMSLELLRRILISWQCKKQTVVSNSTTGAEYVAAFNNCGQVLWIQNQMLDYGYNFINTKIFIDNESTICIVKNPVLHEKTNHIEVRHHVIKDSYEKRLIQVIKIHTDHNVADLLTKAFDVSRFYYLIVTVGVTTAESILDLSKGNFA
nr:retrovirus-related Pol polyprotein from transposon TNT 1-94 [Tanacetum cinerariifolium]